MVWWMLLSQPSEYLQVVPPCPAINFTLWKCTWTFSSRAPQKDWAPTGSLTLPISPPYPLSLFPDVSSNFKVDSLPGQFQEETGQPASTHPSFLNWPITSLLFSPETPTVFVKIVWGDGRYAIPLLQRSRERDTGDGVVAGRMHDAILSLWYLR